MLPPLISQTDLIGLPDLAPCRLGREAVACDRLPGFAGPGPSAALDETRYSVAVAPIVLVPQTPVNNKGTALDPHGIAPRLEPGVTSHRKRLFTPMLVTSALS